MDTSSLRENIGFRSFVIEKSLRKIEFQDDADAFPRVFLQKQQYSTVIMSLDVPLY
jgi:hypothetical protein